MADARRLRERLLTRWLALYDEADSLQHDINGAPAGVFTEDETREALMALDIVASFLMNERPRAYAEPTNPRSLNVLVRAAVRMSKEGELGPRARLKSVTGVI